MKPLLLIQPYAALIYPAVWMPFIHSFNKNVLSYRVHSMPRNLAYLMIRQKGTEHLEHTALLPVPSEQTQVGVREGG